MPHKNILSVYDETDGQVECGVRGDLGDKILATATTTGLFVLGFIVCLFVCMYEGQQTERTQGQVSRLLNV